MKVRDIFLLTILLSMPVIHTPAVSSAGEATEQLRKTVDTVLMILNDKELKKPSQQEVRRTKIRAVVDRNFDFEEMAKRSLGIHWRDRTGQERADFIELYSDLLESTYVRKVERYENERVEYVEEKVEGPYALVKTKIITAKETAIPVDYRIMRKAGKWEVYDVVIEGVSLVNNYRTQFNQIIRSSSYEELVRKLKNKVLAEPS